MRFFETTLDSSSGSKPRRLGEQFLTMICGHELTTNFSCQICVEEMHYMSTDKAIFDM